MLDIVVSVVVVLELDDKGMRQAILELVSKQPMGQ